MSSLQLSYAQCGAKTAECGRNETPDRQTHFDADLTAPI